MKISFCFCRFFLLLLLKCESQLAIFHVFWRINLARTESEREEQIKEKEQAMIGRNEIRMHASGSH